MTAADLKRLCGSAFRRSTFRLRRGRANTAEAPSKGSPVLYPETLSVRYRYQSDGSIVVVTPKGPRYFDDLTNFWSAQGCAPSPVASTSTSDRRLRALMIMLSVLVLVLFAHEIARDVAGGPGPEPAAAKADIKSNIEMTSALAETQKDAGLSPGKTNSPSSLNKPQQAPETNVVADARGNFTNLRLASEQGHADAQFLMGRIYEEGQGVPSNFVEAMKWYRLAAEQGHVTAQYKLGLMYGQGRGMPRDVVEAHKWMTLAASRPPVSESETQNHDAAVALTPAQRVEANRLARHWEQQAAAR